jgi:hypothetical protein
MLSDKVMRSSFLLEKQSTAFIDVILGKKVDPEEEKA